MTAAPNDRKGPDGEARLAGGLVYRATGRGAPALLLHPAYTHGGAFDGEVAALADRLRLIVVDLPGHGATARLADPPTFEGLAERLVAVLDAEGVDAAHVLGVSLGSLVGQDFARRRPERVRSLTALGGYELTDGQIGWAQVGAILSLVPRLVFSPRAFARQVGRLSAASPSGQARFAELAADFRVWHLLQMRGQDEVVDHRRTDALQCPLLIAVGDGDLALARDAARRWHKRLPTSRLVELRNAGHCANLDDPASFREAWMGFVERVEASEGRTPGAAW